MTATSVSTIDWERHNAAVDHLWRSFAAGCPARVPVLLRTPNRFYLQRPEINRKGYTFRDYYGNPEIMWEIQLEGQKWRRLNLLQDAPMGYPEQWNGISVDFHGGIEAIWLGNEPFYTDGNVLDSRPSLQEDKARLFDWEQPDPRHGRLMPQVYEYFEYFEDKRKHTDFEGIPVGPTGFPLGTDGPFTAATKLRGTSELCLDLMDDPDYFHHLLDFITTALIDRIQSGMDFLERTYPGKSWSFCDCTLCILSEKHYREHVLPYHRRMMEAFSTGPYNYLHSCGPVHHLHKTIVDELRVTTFDCGFITDAAHGRRQVGPEILYCWRFHPTLQTSASPEEMQEAVTAMLKSGVTQGRRFTIEEVAYPDVDLHRWEKLYRMLVEQSRYPEDETVGTTEGTWFRAHPIGALMVDA